MRGLSGRKAVFASLPLVFLALAALALWILPKPHVRLHYLLAGTLATAVSLGMTLLTLTLRKRPPHDAPRAVRRAGPEV